MPRRIRRPREGDPWAKEDIVDRVHLFLDRVPLTGTYRLTVEMQQADGFHRVIHHRAGTTASVHTFSAAGATLLRFTVERAPSTRPTIRGVMSVLAEWLSELADDTGDPPPWHQDPLPGWPTTDHT